MSLLHPHKQHRQNQPFMLVETPGALTKRTDWDGDPFTAKTAWAQVQLEVAHHPMRYDAWSGTHRLTVVSVADYDRRVTGGARNG